MNNNVEKFLSEVFGEVRAINKDGEIWFVAKDICLALEYSESNVSSVVSRLDSDQKTTLTLTTSGNYTTNLLCVNEDGLYDIVTGATRKPKAKPFRKWITKTVIPAIRKDGAYIQDEEKVSQGELSEEEFILKAMTIMQNKIDRLSRENAEMKPKVEYVDKILSSTDAVTTTQIAKDYGLSARQLNDILKEEKIQYKQNSQWLLYSKYADKGYMKSDTFRYDKHNGEVGTKINSKWTQQGRLFIHEVLKGRNIKPIA